MFLDELKYIEGLKEGNKEVFKKIFYTFYSPLAAFATKYVEKDVAEEIVQDLMVDLWKQREALQISTSLKSYLFTSVRNKAFNVLRQKEREQKRYKLIANEYLHENESDFDKYIYRELTENISKAINDLPAGYRDTFKLSRLHFMTNKEIAEQEKISIKTVEYRISQALKILRVKLRDYLACLLFL